MKRFFALFAALTLFCTGISAQTAACRTETGIAYRDAAGDGYVDSLCRLDICWPADRKGFPTVVWFHGGGLTGGRREIPKALCGKGFAVVGVDYRLAPRVKVADCVEDAAAAAAWVVRNIASYGGDPELIFIATGSEVELAVAAWDKLTAEGVKARVVSMPSTDAFDKQDAAYRESVLPKAVTARVAVEAGIADYWFKYVGLNGAIVGMTTFGESAPAEQLFEEFGFTVDNVVAKAKALL